MVDSNGTSTIATSAGGRRIGFKGSSEKQRDRHWAAHSADLRTFVNYSYDRDLPLAAPGIAVGTYQRVFRSLKVKGDQVLRHPEPRLFYGPISWKASFADDDRLKIQLSYGEWVEGKLTRPYRVRMSWKDWSYAKRNYVSREVRAARVESIAANERGDKEKGWLFFHWQAGRERFRALSRR